ncbi:mpv17-like protein [Drosophila montana]|uniref:mpv17-like protein n=1 Tax=Drosophila montana TaxID=40370 RepID=UPI00313E1157
MALSGYIREGLNVALIMGAGDMIAQMAVEKRDFKDWNAGRTARFSALGLVLVGPSLRKWYGALDTMVVKEQSTVQRGIKKMLIDQGCFAPPFTLLLSYLVPYINGEKHETIVKRIKENYFTIMKGSFMVWPLAQTINFTLVPVQYQVIYVQVIALFWNCFLSMMLNER